MSNNSFNEYEWLTPTELAKKNNAMRRWPGNSQALYPIIKKYFDKVDGVFLKIGKGHLINETEFYRLVERSPDLTSKARTYEGYREAYDNGKLGKRYEKTSGNYVETLGSESATPTSDGVTKTRAHFGPTFVCRPAVDEALDSESTIKLDCELKFADSTAGEERPATLIEQSIMRKLADLEKSLVDILDKLSFWT